jgi:hypothetical protein
MANRTVTSAGTTTWTYTWGSAGHMLKVSNGTPQGKYAYDGQGRRLESVESSTIFCTRLVTDSRARGSFADDYLPFGQDNGTLTGSQTYKFTGKPVSQTTGLWHERRQPDDLWDLLIHQVCKRLSLLIHGNS